MSSNTIVIVTLIAYKLLLLGIGFWASKRVKSEADFFIAGKGEGKGLGAWTAGLSYAASTSSAWVLLGFTGLVFTKGVIALWLIPGIFAGYIMTWLVMGPRLNAETSERGHITIVDFIVGDVGEKWRRIIGIVCALMILFCFIFYISPQIQAAGNALTSVFGISATEAIIFGATIIVIYCLLGGFWAASITDALQAGVMLGACILVPLMAVIQAGGVGNIISQLHVTQPAAYFSFTEGMHGMLGLGAGLGLLGTGLGALGQPQLLNRIMATKDAATRRKGAMITIGWGVVIYTGLVLLAFAARSLSMDVDGEKLFFVAAEAFLPPVLAGIVIAAVLSAVMSTVDSLLLASASAVSHDMGLEYKSPERALLYGRIAMVAIAVLAVILALTLPQKIFDRVLFAWVALGAAFGPTILTRCLGWRVKGGYVLAAILTGFFIAVISANLAGVGSDMTEKWVSWLIGLLILFIGKRKPV